MKLVLLTVLMISALFSTSFSFSFWDNWEQSLDRLPCYDKEGNIIPDDSNPCYDKYKTPYGESYDDWE